ncbi:50S ribosomal protein L30e-like protein [Schizophyllum commune]
MPSKYPLHRLALVAEQILERNIFGLRPIRCRDPVVVAIRQQFMDALRRGGNWDSSARPRWSVRAPFLASDEKRHNYVRSVAELAVQHFITNDKVNVQGLVLAGSADFKTELSQSDMFDPRLAAKVIKVVDVSYGGENGFNHAIELAAESLANVKFVQEKKLIQRYFDEISQDTGKYCFGVDDTLKALELGAVETLIVWENLDITRYVLRNAAGEEIIVHANKEQEKDREKFIDKSTGLEMEQMQEPQALLEWSAEKYCDFGANLEFVTNRSQEGAQFVKGFGGIGGLLWIWIACRRSMTRRTSSPGMMKIFDGFARP